MTLVGYTGWSSQHLIESDPGAELPKSPSSEFLTAVKAFQNSRLVREKSCLSCHTVGDRGGTVGPILDQVSNRRTEDWLQRWLKDPNVLKPGTRMPNFQFSDSEIEELLSYLTKLRKEIARDEILTANIRPEEKGKRLLEEYGCKACHRVGDEGRFTGVDLTWVGKRKSREWEIGWLNDPQAWKPGTFMPTFGFSDAEAEALAEYLHTLRGQHNDRSRMWEVRALFFLGGSQVYAGRMVYDRFGCWGCHGKNGRKSDKNPNAEPDGKVPKLWGVTDRLSDAEVEETVRNGTRPESLDPDKPFPPLACPRWGESITDQEMTVLIAYLKTLAPTKKEWRFR